jgi:histone-lysine N-methyltransferase SETD2
MQDLHRGSFVYEYVGEVIGERKFRQRQRQYKEQDEKHFYFMMLQKGEYIDATKKGGYGRFINHSCEPNCYVDKWVVGSKMRMGIFCKRHIISGEELTFDYNVDRYGGEATPCYCGEPSCLGYIGGKTQTDAANKLPQNVAEALGIDDNDEIDDAPKRLRRKKGVDDEEYVNTLTPRAIAEHDVPKIMATLVLPTERWLLKKLLQRIASAEDDRIHSSIIRLHGYQTLGSKLEKYHDDAEIATLILGILHTWPRVTRNKISSSKIEQHVKGIAAADSMHESVKALATELLQIWGELKMAYRIPRRTAGHRPQHDVQLGSPSSSSPSETSPEPSASLHRPRARHSIPRWPPVIRPGVTDDLRRSQASRPSSASVPAQGELQAIIDAATRLQQEQAALAQAEAEKKESEETLRLAAEAKQRSERAHKHQLRKARKEEKAMRRIRPSVKGKERDYGHQSSSEKDAVTNASIVTNSAAPTEDMSKILERQFAKVVPNFVSKYQATLGKDEVKKRAREIVKILVAKELARPSPSLETFSMEKLAKIKAYSKEFMHKLLARSAVKSADHSGGRTNAMTPADVSDGVSLKRDYDQFQTGQAEKAQECADGS